MLTSCPVSERLLDTKDIKESEGDFNIYDKLAPLRDSMTNLITGYNKLSNFDATVKCLTYDNDDLVRTKSRPIIPQSTEKRLDKVDEKGKGQTLGDNTLGDLTHIINNNSSFYTMDSFFAIFNPLGNGLGMTKISSGEEVLGPRGQHSLHSQMTSATQSVDSEDGQELSSGNLRKAYQGKDGSSARFSGATNKASDSQVSVSVCLL